MKNRFFSDESYWNTKIPKSPKIHPQSSHYVDLLKGPNNQKGFHTNLLEWTLPIYPVDCNTPMVRVEKRMKQATQEGGLFYLHSKEYINSVGENNHPMGHTANFGANVPIPEDAIYDAHTDSHMTLVNYDTGIAWDMWAVQKKLDGTWWANSGNTYSIEGSGVFPEDIWKGIHNGESAHMYGATHASGVPNIAGMILYDEIKSGQINHKLNWSCEFVALLEHIYPPATWTDGSYPNGIPQGALLQLNPDLDLDNFGLSKNEKIVATALQVYGAALVMYSGSTTLHGEGLWANKEKNWEGVLSEEGMMKIPFENYRFIDSGKVVETGMVPMQHPGTLGTYFRKTGLPNFDFKA